MKRAAYFIVAFVCLFGNIAIAQTAKQKVAVYVTGEAESGIKKVIGSKLVTGITKSDKYIAVERTTDFLSELTKEQDYQTSGVVSDNQIVKLGQQFGVRYVLVTDISEVFGSMFVTTRLIDVQTAQIINSTEENATINNMESLTRLSDNIILKLLYTNEFSKDNIRITGPYSTVEELDRAINDYPSSGYHMATQEEIWRILKNSRIRNETQKVPIYTDIKAENIVKQQSIKNSIGCRYYHETRVTCSIIYSDESSKRLDLSYIDDGTYEGVLRIEGPVAGLYNLTNIPSITRGYVYWVKDVKQ